MGDDRSLRVDVRVLAATDRDLREEVLAGNFRVDLLHRLRIFPFSVPPPREHGEDMVPLADYLCEQCRPRLSLSRVMLSPGACSHLLNYGRPENVRELEHAIHRAVVLARATRASDEVVLEIQHFALQDEGSIPQAAEAVAKIPQHHNLREATGSFQRETIRRALVQNNHGWMTSTRAPETDVANLHRLAKRLGLKG